MFISHHLSHSRAVWLHSLRRFVLPPDQLSWAGELLECDSSVSAATTVARVTCQCQHVCGGLRVRDWVLWPPLCHQKRPTRPHALVSGSQSYAPVSYGHHIMVCCEMKLKIISSRSFVLRLYQKRSFYGIFTKLYRWRWRWQWQWWWREILKLIYQLLMF